MSESSTTPPTIVPLITGVVYGPVKSRRLGTSLGVNILPPGMKVCTFNCVYCQYGWTSPIDPSGLEWPSPNAVAAEISAALRTLSATRIDRITLAGHGEPTLHPQFPAVVEAIRSVRDRHTRSAAIAILSNGTRAHLPAVQAALRRIDEPYIKLDAGDPRTLRRTNASAHDLGLLLDAIRALPHAMVQSMFVEDPTDRCGNAAVDSMEAWRAVVSQLRPRGVHIYTLARGPALARLRAVAPERLERLAAELRALGIPADVFV